MPTSQPRGGGVVVVDGDGVLRLYEELVAPPRVAYNNKNNNKNNEHNVNTTNSNNNI